MSKGRLEAFSDGVIAILITIMVLELKVPEAPELRALRPLVPIFSAYTLSFIFIAIYWNNHHHMLHAAQRVNGKVLWANQHLLFWLSLVPFATAWVGEHPAASLPSAAYGVVLLMCAVSYTILQRTILAQDLPGSKLAEALGGDSKGKVSLGLYLCAVPLAFVSPWISSAIYVIVALMWLVPDRRIEQKIDPQAA
jgi:uncharacterized membrane protein